MTGNINALENGIAAETFFKNDPNYKKTLRKFLGINGLKLQRTFDSLRTRQQDFLQLLPLLFHINHPLLPGFVSSQCPAGIPKYSPDKEAIRRAKRIAKSFEHKRRAYRQYDIQALYFMGSTGTIAYSDKSDFDVWVCHREDLSKLELKELQLKTERITEWCAGFRLEVNFFLINTQLFRQGKIAQLSSESSGSTQHMLLLEEFYRTSILLAGRYPIWWLVPPEYEKDYDHYVQNMLHKRLINEHDFLNFGSIANIPAEEFYGATLWHIYKGIDSPYKSILKLLLMECYAKEHPHIDLLSFRFKQAVYLLEKPDIDRLDPYIMMMEKITDHLKAEDSYNRLELARQCLYLKVNESLSKLKYSGTQGWRQKLMQQLVNTWNWQHVQLLLLDERSSWKIDEVSKEHKNIIDALTHSYKKLSDFFRYQNRTIRISKRDLHILGRKLYAAFEKKAGKIEVISHDDEINLFEPHVSLHPVSSSNKQTELGWSMYAGALYSPEKKHLPIKKSTHLTKLLCWGYFNRVINSHTNFIVNKDVNHVSSRDLKQIISALEQTFPHANPGYATMEELVKPAQLDLNVLFLNLGHDPFLTRHPAGTQITTNKTDALNYGSRHENLLITIDQVLMTTWREIMTQHFEAETGLIECLCQYLKWNHETETAQASPVPKRPTLVSCFSSVRGESISRRISQLFNNVINAFHTAENAYTTRYLLSIEQSFYILWQDETGPKYQKIPDHKELIRELSYPLPRFNRLIIDDEFCDNKVLKLIYSMNKENIIQLFYQNHRKSADIYIIDERGSLFHQSTSIETNSTHINHYILFLDTVINRLCFTSDINSLIVSNQDTTLIIPDDDDFDVSANGVDLQLEVFEIQKQRQNELTLDEQFSRLQSMPVKFLKIQVIADLTSEGKRTYNIYANDKEFTSYEHGSELYHKVAEEVVNSRYNRETYPIYITDIDLSQELRDAESSNGLQVTQLLKFKQEIERRLNQAIKNL
jgi:adenylate cyclase class 1